MRLVTKPAHHRNLREIVAGRRNQAPRALDATHARHVGASSRMEFQGYNAAVVLLRKLTLETTDARWGIEIFRRGSELVGQYVGIGPKAVADVSGTGRLRLLREVGQGECTGPDIESVIAACRAEIEKLDGEIQGEGAG